MSTAGESHGKELSAILEGLPAGSPISHSFVTQKLQSRQKGFGRSGRMKLEADEVRFLSGLYNEKSTGAPIGLSILNHDQSLLKHHQPDYVPRPGHVDLAAGQKLNEKDFRLLSERGSARETAMRVALGAIAASFLKNFGIQIVSQVIQIGKACSNKCIPFTEWPNRVCESEFHCGDPQAEAAMRQAIVAAAKNGDSLGGSFQVAALNIPPGLGHYVTWEKRLDARIGYGLLSIPAIKSFEIGAGKKVAQMNGSELHDSIVYKQGFGFQRTTNQAGGIEGGISTGEPIWITAAMKPLPTLRDPLSSIDVQTKKEAKAPVSRADICAVPAASIVGEAMMGLIILDAFLEKFGNDSFEETKRNYNGYLTQLKNY